MTTKYAKAAYIDGYLFKEAELRKLAPTTSPAAAPAAPSTQTPTVTGSTQAEQQTPATPAKGGWLAGIKKFVPSSVNGIIPTVKKYADPYIEDLNKEWLRNNPDRAKAIGKDWMQNNPDTVKTMALDYVKDPTNQAALLADPALQKVLKEQMMKSPQMKKMMGFGGAAIAGLGGMNIWQMMKNRKLQQQLAAMQNRPAPAPTQGATQRQPYAYRYR